MSRIANISKLIKILLLFLALLQLAGFVVLLLVDSSYSSHYSVWLANFGLSSAMSFSFDNSWHDFAELLAQQQFDPILILGIAATIPYLLIYYFLYQLFSLYQQGIIFTQKNTTWVKCIAIVLLGWIGLNLLYPVLVTLVLRLSGASSTLPIMVNLGSTELGYLLTGLIIYVIAWIMNEAIELKQEQALVI
jgi:hypothetical protein